MHPAKCVDILHTLGLVLLSLQFYFVVLLCNYYLQDIVTIQTYKMKTKLTMMS